MTLQGREILLGVAGGIACYKAVEVLRGLKRAGAQVSVVMTEHAQEFVTPLTFQTLSNRPVATLLFDLDQESRIGHIALAQQAELVLVVPCTANVVAKLRAGLADDLLTTLLLATTAPVYLAPAMNDRMLQNAATQENLDMLRSRGMHILPPAVGFLAEGHHGVGRLADPAEIVAAVAGYFCSSAQQLELPRITEAAPTQLAGATGLLTGKRVVITAGPTHEAIDPVRYLTNPSSGRMGFALAEACRDAGARVDLVTGPVALEAPAGIETVRVVDARQMFRAVLDRRDAADVVICAAAVSDFRPKTLSAQKIKRDNWTDLKIDLDANPDIAAEVGRGKRSGQVLVVFAAESHDLIAYAHQKLVSKNADLMVANDITAPGAGFQSTTNRVTLLWRSRDGIASPRPETLPLMEKRQVAERIVERVAALLGRRIADSPLGGAP